MGSSQDWVEELIKGHRDYFYTGKTKSLDYRIAALNKLKQVIKKYEQEILTALYLDLGKNEFEAYTTEVGFILDSISYFTKNLRRWARPKRVRASIHQVPSKNYSIFEPYGTVLIIGPYNYPFQLLIEPLIGALAAGNCAVLKPSEATPQVSALVKRLLNETFDEGYVSVIEGEKETTSALINGAFDYIFFTGSVEVGKIVMQAAAKNLVPVTLELGGKSPTIVDKCARLDVAAKRIIWGKLLNTGQTCVAPDYIYVHKEVREAFILKLKEAIMAFYGGDASKSKDYGRIVNEKQFDRLRALIEDNQGKIIYGGSHCRETLYIEPTLFDRVTWQDTIMEDEIFGPLLPILEYENLNEVIAVINGKPKPLALYVFTEDQRVEATVLSQTSFGGGCVNDTIFHVSSPHLPFGGVGASGMGSYHGRTSFETFSHQKNILKRGTRFNLELLYPPYGNKLSLIRRLLK